jgi:hypothetical protein
MTADFSAPDSAQQPTATLPFSTPASAAPATKNKKYKVRKVCFVFAAVFFYFNTNVFTLVFL